MDMKDVSKWTIWIDDLDGELAMDERDCTGRNIDVLAEEEVSQLIKQLERQHHNALDCVVDQAMRIKKLEDHLVGLANEVLTVTTEADQSPHVQEAMRIRAARVVHPPTFKAT